MAQSLQNGFSTNLPFGICAIYFDLKVHGLHVEYTLALNFVGVALIVLDTGIVLSHA